MTRIFSLAPDRRMCAPAAFARAGLLVLRILCRLCARTCQQQRRQLDKNGRAKINGATATSLQPRAATTASKRNSPELTRNIGIVIGRFYGTFKNNGRPTLTATQAKRFGECPAL